MNAAHSLNEQLKGLFDLFDDLYKSVISDSEGESKAEINNPMDLNMGAIGNLVEWNRLLTKSLTKELNFNNATGGFLDLFVDIIGIQRGEAENITDYKRRVKDIILGYKGSSAAVIYYLRPYSDSDPMIFMGSQDSAFADCSFSDFYETFRDEDTKKWILPAVTRETSQTLFSFTVVLVNTRDTDIEKVIDIIDRIKPAGISFNIEIRK